MSDSNRARQKCGALAQTLDILEGFMPPREADDFLPRDSVFAEFLRNGEAAGLITNHEHSYLRERLVHEL